MWLRLCLKGISALLLFIAVANAREWTDSTAKFTYEADFIDLKDGNVKLRLNNGTIKSLPLEKLSQEDQKFARQTAAVPKKTTARPSEEMKVGATSQPTKALPTNDALVKDIERAVVALGYSEDTADDLARLAREWKCARWKQTLRKARGDFSAEKTVYVVRVEEKVAKALYETIGKEIGRCDEAETSKYFKLSEVVRDKKAQCLGYSQLLYILGNSVGLRVKVIDVLEPASGSPPLGQGHVACLVSLSDGTTVMVDIAMNHVSRPFVFKETFAEVGNYWECNRGITSSEIHRRIQILNYNGLVACINNNRGVAYGKLGQHAKATIEFTKAIEQNPKCAKAYYNRGVEYGISGQHAEAISDYTKAIELDPKNANAYNNRGGEYGRSRQSTKAISDFTMAIELNPTNGKAYSNRGNEYGRSGQDTKARSDFAKAAELNPTLAESHFSRGVMHDKSGHDAEAIAEFSKAIEIDPKSAAAYYNRGVAYGKSGKHAEAISDYSKAIELNPKDFAAYSNRGVENAKSGEATEAISDFTKAIGLNPKLVEAYLARGIVHAVKGMTDEARADLQKSAALDPTLRERIMEISAKYELGL
jgi:tetratricopeptide (TPR) repeat protein